MIRLIKDVHTNHAMISPITFKPIRPAGVLLVLPRLVTLGPPPRFFVPKIKSNFSISLHAKGKEIKNIQELEVEEAAMSSADSGVAFDGSELPAGWDTWVPESVLLGETVAGGSGNSQGS